MTHSDCVRGTLADHGSAAWAGRDGAGVEPVSRNCLLGWLGVCCERAFSPT